MRTLEPNLHFARFGFTLFHINNCCEFGREHIKANPSRRTVSWLLMVCMWRHAGHVALVDRNNDIFLSSWSLFPFLYNLCEQIFFVLSTNMAVVQTTNNQNLTSKVRFDGGWGGDPFVWNSNSFLAWYWYLHLFQIQLCFSLPLWCRKNIPVSLTTLPPPPPL